MLVVGFCAETSICIPISSTKISSGRLNPKTTIFYLEQPTLATSKRKRNSFIGVHLNLIDLQRLCQFLNVFFSDLSWTWIQAWRSAMTSSCCSVGFPDCIDIENFIFDEQKKDLHLKWTYAVLNRKTTCNRAFLFWHYTIWSFLWSFCVVFVYSALILQTNYRFAVLAFLSACIEYIIPCAKEWTKKILRNLIVSTRSWTQDVVKLNWCLIPKSKKHFQAKFWD